MTIEHARQGRAGDAELLCGFGDRQAQCGQDVFLEGFAALPTELLPRQTERAL